MKTAAFSAAELRFWGWIPPGLNLSEIHARGRGGLQPGASRDCRPPWGPARKPTTPLGVSHGEVRKPTALPGLPHGEVRKPTTLPGLLRGEARKPTTTVAFARAGFFGRATGRNGALPYNARKSQFLRNGDVWAMESLFLFAVLWLAFLPGQSETGVAGGGKARRPKPRPPRGGPPNDRDRLPVFAPPARTPAPATPPQSACSRRLSGCP